MKMSSATPLLVWIVTLGTSVVTVPALCHRAPSRHATRFTFVDHGAGARAVQSFRRRARRIDVGVRKTLGGTGDVPLTIHVYPTLEAKGLETGYTMPVHSYSGRGEMYVSAEPGVRGEFERELASLLVQATLGRAGRDVFAEGLALYFVERWGGRPPLYWAGRLADMAGEIPLDRLTAQRSYRALSPLLRRPLAAAMISLFVKKAGWDALRTSWVTGAVPSIVSNAWPQYLRTLVRRYPHVAQRGRFAPPAPGLPHWHRGFCFAHEGYHVRDGYVSKNADRALDRLVGLNVNAVSITPFTFMRDPNSPVRFPFSEGAGDENDEAVIHATRGAHRRKMAVMLKPHLWVPRSWPGGVDMHTPQDWRRFFKYYEEWILHYAMLAEMTHCEIFCVGVELTQATFGHEERWVRLIHRVRRIYGGKLTYAANWGEEFEHVTFWNSLDFAGIDCYYPLSTLPGATDDELRAGAREVIRKIDTVGKRWKIPVLITEVGFTSTAATWISPHERQRGVVGDEKAQARCYDAFFRAVAKSRTVRGMYWWKWPSYLEYGGKNNTGFTPDGKAAERVVRRWFRNPAFR